MFKVETDHTLGGGVEVQGWQHVPGVDCDHTYVPVCCIESIRMALAIPAREDWEVFQLDVPTMLLNASVQKEVHT